MEDTDGSISAVFQLIVITANADPVFTQQQYSFNISEDAPVDFTIGNVPANDDDSKSLMKLKFQEFVGSRTLRLYHWKHFA